jgi:hypothetical protein
VFCRPAAIVVLLNGTTACLLLGRATSAHAPVPLPEGLSWVVLAHEGGLGGPGAEGLVAAVWPDGTVFRQVQPRSLEDLEAGTIPPAEVQHIRQVIAASGIEGRRTAGVALAVPYEGLVIRGERGTRCWYSTEGTEGTPGLSQIAVVLRRLPVKSWSRTKLRPEQWLPWTHYWERACGS